ncbi:hypothetical protein EIN_249250 [Entamoeba invadens IP1]|uniref:Uncharacterized protein n=1 Tax=Entamoeba invadens IP1 TaxID=370355 RepID=A0A0A1UE63_ENTIV|nr:hypothetical protein EIN_249250 [Entamoeba invadens IP1]ELP94891.1 hypothetical protein EIN_249250 [Entamoeba invadens IP1]|eukprot:XP_004261662.1 hypothetical protein EIN_249250 [Entamoeba invadens IP1]
MAKSMFTPCRKDFYEVVIGFGVPSSPTLSNETVSTTLNVVEEKKSPKRKRWSKDVRQRAVLVGQELGLSKAIRLLQKQPDYKDLCASTLYYWIKSSDHHVASASKI